MNTRLKRLSLLFLVLLMSLASYANPTKRWFEQANNFYENQQFDSAIAYYEKILGTGINNSNVLYNLGNSYFRQDKLGLAILHYERALRLAPHDPDINTNLRFARLHIVDRVPEPPHSFIQNLFWFLHTMFPLSTQIWILLILLFIISIAFSFGLFASHNIRLWLIYTAGLCILISSLFGFSIGFKIYETETKEYAVVLNPTVETKNEPNGDKILFTAHEGIKFLVQKSVDNWSLVSLPNGLSGWIENSALGRI